MSLSIGIVGLPNVGKSTLFNALTQKGVPAENYPFCTIDPAVGIVAVPDDRIELLNTFSKSAKKIPAAIEFVDIAGLVKGAAEGEGLGNQFLSHIREVDAIAEVVRVFIDKNVIHVSGQPDPISDIETINLELILADLQTVAKRLQTVARDAKRGDKPALAEQALLEKLAASLKAGQMITQTFQHSQECENVGLGSEEAKILKSLHLLSAKPILYVLNKKQGAETVDLEPVLAYLKKLASPAIASGEGGGAQWVIVDAKIEGELSELEAGDRAEFKQELGVVDDGINDLITASYKLLSLMTFFTTGTDEIRAWTIKQGSTTPEAGAAIHTDFREKYIRAEVIGYQDLLSAGSYGAAREKGLLRTEGKDYLVKDGDVIEFKI